MRAARIAVILPVLVFTSACASPPEIAERNEYDPPRWDYMPHLRDKAALHEAQIDEMIDHVGMLCYWQAVPWIRNPDGSYDLTWKRYRSSHNVADAPAWQGYLMAAVGFQGAIAQREEDTETVARVNAQLRRLAAWYPYFYNVTGQSGLIGRTVIAGYHGAEPLWFIVEGGVERSHWRRSETTGEWWRDDLAKDHLNLAVMGLAVPLALNRRGDLELEPATRRALIDAMLPLVKRLADNDYVIVNQEGDPTQFGDIDADSFILPNGFQRVLSWHMLASAAPYNKRLREEYEEKLDDWKSGLVWSMETSGDYAKARGRWHSQAQLSNSDTQALAMAAMSFLLQEDREDRRKPVLDALDAWWDFMQYELNAPFTLVYAHFVEEGPRNKRRMVEPIIQELRDFPPEKHPGRFKDEENEVRITSGVVQPIWNRPVSTNYWKSNAFEEVLASEEQNEKIRFAPMDYLLAYWMGRYFDLVPES